MNKLNKYKVGCVQAVSVIFDIEKTIEADVEFKEPVIKRGLRAEGKYAMQALAYVCPHALFTLSRFEKAKGFKGDLPGQSFEIRRLRHQMHISLTDIRSQNRCYDLIDNKETRKEFWGVEGKNILALYDEFIKTGNEEAFGILRKGMDNLVTTLYMEILSILVRKYADEVSKKYNVDEKEILKRCKLVEAVSVFHQLTTLIVYSEKAISSLEGVKFDDEEDNKLKEHLIEGFEAVADYKTLTAKLQEARLGKMTKAVTSEGGEAQVLDAKDFKKINEADSKNETQFRKPPKIPVAPPEQTLKPATDIPPPSAEPVEA